MNLTELYNTCKEYFQNNIFVEQVPNIVLQIFSSFI